MITLNQLSMVYGNKLLFTDVSLKLTNNTRYALVGANGAGKSTLLRLMMSEEQASDGEISIPKAALVGWLKQDQFRYENTKIVDIVLQGKPKLWQALIEKERLLSAELWDEKTGYQLAELEEIIAHTDGYTAVALAEKLLLGLGIAANYHQQPLKALSGGYKLRVLLAQTLFQQPDILLLDEPTNHLDIISINWLERYLKTEFTGLLVFISHDMQFIDRLADFILDIDYGEIRQYSGNYQLFLAEKKQIEEQKLHIRQHLEEKIAVMQRFVDKFRASASRAKQAQSRVKMIEKLELPDVKKSSRVAPYFYFKPDRPSGKQVLKAKNLTKTYQHRQIFKQLSFDIHKGERIAIIGANGIGKSTLIKALLGIVTLDAGSYEWGYETHLSYFSQNHHDDLNKRMSVIDWMSDQIPAKPTQLLRKVLGQVLFTQDDVVKNILALSGGEAARLLLARIMLQAHNVLVLDEPTNHLDLEASEALAHALSHYSGTLVFISHNRHFIKQIATRILFITSEEKVVDFKGDYAEFETEYQT